MFEIRENKLILTVDDKNVGHIIFDEQDDHFVGAYVFVDPEHRGKQYADQLVKEFVKMSSDKNKKINPICHVIKRKLTDNYPNMIK